MSFTFAIGTNGDLFINKSGALQTVYGAQEVKQRILIALNHEWQEYFLNVPAGVPWYEIILGSKDLKLAASLLRQTIGAVPGVVSIVSLDIYRSAVDPRQMEISVVVEVTGQQGTEIVYILQELTKGL